MLLARGQLLKNLENLEPPVCGLEAATVIQVRTCSPTMAQYCGGARMVQHKADLAVCGGGGHARAAGYTAADWVAAAAAG